MKCYICQGSLGRHAMKVKMDRRVRRICNRVDKEHADWLLDQRMDTNYLRITRKRRGGIMGIIVLMLAFVALIWAFTYFQDFKPLFVAVSGTISLLIGVIVIVEFKTITVSDRMRALLTEVELARPVVSPLPHPSMERLDEVAALAGEAEPEMGRVAIHTTAEPAPTQTAASRPSVAAEYGIPGIPQPVVVAREWEVMGIEDQTPGGPRPPPGTPAQPVPPPPTIEDLPDPGAPAPGVPPPQIPPQIPPPIAAPPPPAPPPTPALVQQAPPPPPAAAPPALVQELPAERAPPPPPSTVLTPQAPPSPPQPPAQPFPQPPQPQRPPVQTPPPVQQPPAQVPPPVPQPPAQVPPVQYQSQPVPTPPSTPPRKPKAEGDDVEEAEWVDWE